MSRAVLSIAATVLALTAMPAAAGTPSAPREPAAQVTQISPDKGVSPAYQQRRAAVDKLNTEYESAAAQFDANDTVLDREAATLKQRQALLDLHKRSYREAVARCVDTTCIDALNPQRDAVNADQVALNHDIDAHNARMAKREQDAEKLDQMEKQIGDLRAELQRLETDMAAPQPAAVR